MKRIVLAALAASVCAASQAHAHICLTTTPTVTGAYPDRAALAYACDQHRAHAAKLTRTDVLTIIDFKYSSGYPRLLVIDTRTGEVLARHYTTHGRDSDQDDDGRPDGREGACNTLYGAYRTEAIGMEQNPPGAFVDLTALDPNLSPETERRGVRVAGRDYVSPREAGRLRPGRSCGGFMVVRSVIDELARKIAGGALLVAVPPVDVSP